MAHKHRARRGGRTPDPNSKSRQAARWAHENGASYKLAGERFGISAQAVCQAWALLHPGSNRYGRRRGRTALD